MLNIWRCNPGIGCLLLACAALAGCAPKTNVSVTGNVPAQYSHVYMTVQEVRFNKSATAVPDDTTWTQFTLTTPVTVDLANSMSGTLTSLTTGLSLAPATYAQVRLIPVDSGTPLVSSASTLGIRFNSEVQYVDGAGNTQQLPLELQNPDKGIGIDTTLTITAKTTSLGAVGTATTTNTGTNTNNTGLGTTNTGTNTNGTGLGTTNTGTTTTPTTTTTTTTTNTSTTSTATPAIAAVTAAINVDSSRDLVPFFYNNGLVGLLLNPHLSVYDTSTVGAITGTLTLAGLTGISSTSSSNFNIQVTAEALSADGTRHEQVNSTTVKSDGTFVLYPLPTSSSSPTSYDLVIHGPAIATIIVKGVTVNVGDPATTTPVSIGTLTPRTATPFSVNLTTNTTLLPAGAIVGFYQTLPGSGEVPYLIEQAPIDPFARNFASNEPLSPQTIDYGTLSSGSVTPTAATPTEGASTYRVTATAPLFADEALSTTVAPSGSATTAALVTPPAMTVESGATATSASFTIKETTSGKYDAGWLIISHDGTIVATADLGPILSGGGSGTLTVAGIPGGTSSTTYASGLYYVSVRTWHTGNSALLNRETYPTALDLRNGATTGYSLSID